MGHAVANFYVLQNKKEDACEVCNSNQSRK